MSAVVKLRKRNWRHFYINYAKDLGGVMKIALKIFKIIFLCHYFTEEEINSPELIADLADRDADAPIFGKLGFTYGKAARFKREFATKKTSYGSANMRPCSPAPSKPSMVEISNFNPEMKRHYLSK